MGMILLVLPANASDRVQDSQTDQPYRVEEFSLNGTGDLQVRTSGGHITVEGSNTNTVRVEMYVKKNGRELQPSDTDLDEFEIEIYQSGDRVRALARRKNSNNWGFWNNNNTSISFVVYTPTAISTDLRTSGGHIETKGIEGRQSIRTSGGHLSLNDMKGDVRARTSGGHIEILGFEGNMEARTSGGHIDLIDSDGSINVRTSGGHIDISNVSGSLTASTSGGSIDADLLSIGDFVDLHTSGGNITLTVPSNMGLDLDLEGSRVRSNLRNFSGEIEDDEIHGSINGGGPKISARTSGGYVRLSFR